MMEILFHYDAGPELRDKLKAFCSEGLNITCVSQSDDDGFQDALTRSDIVWHVLKPIDADHIKAAPRLRLIQKIGVGVNTIDLQAARKAGIAVCNMPGTNTQAVSEMTLLLMLSALRLQPRMDKICRSGQWTPDAATAGNLQEISGKTVGLMGFGAVPARLAPILSALGAKVVYWSRSKKDVPYEWMDQARLIREADIISLHLPLSDETHQLISAREISMMKRGVILINTSRGGLIHQPSLMEALRSGHIAAAGLDVFDQEPVRADLDLLQLDQVVVSPHTAWLTRETLDRSIEVALRNSKAIITGEPLVHQVI